MGKSFTAFNMFFLAQWSKRGRRREKPRATAWKTTGNKIYNDGQQNLEQRATNFGAMGDAI